MVPAVLTVLPGPGRAARWSGSPSTPLRPAAGLPLRSSCVRAAPSKGKGSITERRGVSRGGAEPRRAKFTSSPFLCAPATLREPNSFGDPRFVWLRRAAGMALARRSRTFGRRLQTSSAVESLRRDAVGGDQRGTNGWPSVGFPGGACVSEISRVEIQCSFRCCKCRSPLPRRRPTSYLCAYSTSTGPQQAVTHFVNGRPASAAPADGRATRWRETGER
jgi:hypothetical protein